MGNKQKPHACWVSDRRAVVPRRRKKPATRHRRLRLELLEPRIVLSGTNATIGEPQTLEDGLQGLVAWAEQLEQHSLVSVALPVIGQALGQSLDLSDIIQSRFVNPIVDFLNTQTTPDSDGLVARLNDDLLDGVFGNLGLTISNASGGLITGPRGNQELVFSVELDATRTLDLPVSLGAGGAELGFVFGSTVQLAAGMKFDFTFGVDLTAGVAPADAFFIRDTTMLLTAGATAHLQAGTNDDGRVGMFEVKFVGDLNLTGQLDVTLSDGGDETLTLTELSNLPLDQLVSFDTTGSAATGQLQFEALAAFGFAGVKGTITLNTNQPFDKQKQKSALNVDIDPIFDPSALEKLYEFNNLNSFEVVAGLEQLAAWLDAVNGTDSFSKGLRIIGGVLGEVVDLEGILGSPAPQNPGDASEGLISGLLDGQGLPTFDSAQSLRDALAAFLNIPPEQLPVTYDNDARELTYTIALGHTFADQTFPLDLDLDLSPVGSITTNSAVDVSATGGFQFTFGFDLKGIEAEIVGSAAAPANGQLSDTAQFSLSVNLAQPVNVTVPRDVANTSRDDLVEDINTALATAGLADKAAAFLAGDRIGLRTLPDQQSFINILVLHVADANNPAITQLHFQNGQTGSDSILSRTFVENASINANLLLDAQDIDALAKFGFAGIAVNDGTGSANVNLGLSLKDPLSGIPGGRIYLGELFQGLDDVSSIIDGPNLTGNVQLDLPITVTPDSLGTGEGNASLELNCDLFDLTSCHPQFHNAETLLDLSNIEQGNVVGAIQQLVNFLSQLEGVGTFFTEPLPIINVSLAEVADFASSVGQLVHGFETNPGGTLQEVEQTLEQALGLAPATVDLSLVDENEVLRIDFAVHKGISEQLPLNLDLGLFELGSWGNLIQIESTGQLSFEGAVDFDVSLGIELSTLGTFLYEGSQLQLSGRLASDDIDLSTAAGPFSVSIRNGMVRIDGDGKTDAPDDDRVFLTVEFDDEDAETDRIPLTDVLNHLDVGLSGALTLVLPTFFPDPATPQGNIELTVTNLAHLFDSTLPGTVEFTVPDFELESLNFDLFSNLGLVVNGIDLVLGGFEDVMRGEVFGLKLPLIGDGLQDGAQFISDIRTGMLADLRARFAENQNQTHLVIRQALFDAFGPDGENILQDNPLQDEECDEQVTICDVIMTVTDEDGVPENGFDDVHFAVSLADPGVTIAVPIDVDFGLPALGLEVTGQVQLELGYEWDLAFGVSRAQGFYIDTSKGEELRLNLRASIPGLEAEGRLGFLQVDAVDLGSVFDATLAVNLRDPVAIGPPNRLTFNDLGRLRSPFDLFEVYLNGTADVDLDLLASVEGNDLFPSIGTQLKIDWQFPDPNAPAPDPNAPRKNTESAFQGSKPTVEFDNVRLNVGQFINDFLAPITESVRELLAPFNEIISLTDDEALGLLEQPVPILSEEPFNLDVTFLDLAKLFGVSELELVDDVRKIGQALGGLGDVSDQFYIPLGSFKLPDSVDPRNDEDLKDAQLGPDDKQETNPKDELMNTTGEHQADAQEAMGFLDSLPDGLELPILESPSNVFSILMGQQVDLVRYDMPPLIVNFPFPPLKIGPLIPPIPLFATFGGGISAGIDLAFGFDTYGLEKFKQTGDVLDIFDGFYISDTENADGTGEDVVEGFLQGRVTAGVELNIGVASAGVEGGVFATLGADLHDPDLDGRVHLDEFLQNLQRGLQCTFDVSGDVSAGLTAYVDVLFPPIHESAAILPFVQLINFNLTNADCYPDRFPPKKNPLLPNLPEPPTHNNSLLAATDIGVGPGQHLDGLALEEPDDEDWYRFELLWQDSVVVETRFSHAIGNVDLEVYDEAGQLLGASTSELDREQISLKNLPAGNYYARVFGTGQRNTYKLFVEPEPGSNTRIIYVNRPGDKPQRQHSFYAFEPGSDNNDGLSYTTPKATLQNVLDTFDLGPNDLVVMDSSEYYDANVTMTAEDGGATFVGVPIEFHSGSATRLVGDLVLDGVDNTRFDRFLFVANSPSMTINDSDNNIIARSIFEGTTDGLHIAGDGVDDATGNVIRDNDFQNGGTSVRIDSTRRNSILDNRFTSPGPGLGLTGIHVSANVPAVVSGNDIAARATGLYSDSVIADIYGNVIHNNTVGMTGFTGVLGPDNPPPYGAAGGLSPNEIFNNEVGVRVPLGSSGMFVRFGNIHHNTTGIEAFGHEQTIVANDIHDNTTGLRGTGVLGPDGWEDELSNFIHDNNTGVVAEPGAVVQFNRIYENTTGIATQSDTRIHHNLIYRNAGSGVAIGGADNVGIVNNTIDAPGGDGVRLENFSSGIDLRNNIIWVESGYGLYVDASSQFGYTSDYNNLFATGSGKVAFQGKDFGDLYDWQVEAESDLHSIGATRLAPGLDNPNFVDLGNDDFHLRPGSTSIAAGDPASDAGLEPQPNGDRINLGAYGGTLQATESPVAFLDITFPDFYADLVPGNTYPITWNAFNVGGDVDIDLIQFDPVTGQETGKIGDIATVAVADGTADWTPGSFASGSSLNRYRIRLTAEDGTTIVESREPFAIPDVEPAAATTFYVDDVSDQDDEYTPGAIGNNRNTGTTPNDPKIVIRPLLLSYALGLGDRVLVDTGHYIHAVNLNLGCGSLPDDPRINTACGVGIFGPTTPGFPDVPGAVIDRANDTVERSVGVHLRNADDMTFKNLVVGGAGVGMLVGHGSGGSENFQATNVQWNGNSYDGVRIESASDGAVLTACTADNNGRYGIFVDSLLTSIDNCNVSGNGEIGIAGRSIGGAVLHNNVVSGSPIGIDIINPGSLPRAVVGNDDLPAFHGNQVHDNSEINIFASGNVSVAGNHVFDGKDGIRLDGGADATRNVVHGHADTGIDANGSSSEITDNRVYLNRTGIVASQNSQIARNVVYSHEQYGIHVNQFSGDIDHNIVYQTGGTSILVAGPGVGAQLTSNTVYETCAANEPPALPPRPAEGTVVELPWDWTIFVTPADGVPFTTQLWGRAQIKYGTPAGESDPTATFALGSGGGPDALTTEPIPAFNPSVGGFDIPIEVIALRLDGFDPSPSVGRMAVTLGSLPSSGSVNVSNFSGFVSAFGNLAFQLTITFPDQDLTLTTSPSSPLAGDIFSGSKPIDEFQALQTVFEIFGDTPVPLLAGDGNRWGQIALVGGTKVSDEPQDRGDTCGNTGIHITDGSRYVELRNNAAYVEGQHGGGIGSVIAVDADSMQGIDSDHNLVGVGDVRQVSFRWRNTQGDLADWQAATRQDPHSVEVRGRMQAEAIWADPDGDDNRLGGYFGEDDNFHLASPYGQAKHGSPAPAIDPTTSLPQFIDFDPNTDFLRAPNPDPKHVSRGVDAGDRSSSFADETAQHGQVINVGAFGNTEQASKSRDEYVNMVFPLGGEELVPGRTYEIEWRTNLNDPVDIKLYHGIPGQPGSSVERTIDPAAANTGGFLWTVPADVPVDDDYCVGATIPGSGDDVTGACIAPFSVGPDTTPPVVEGTTPDVIHHEQATNTPITFYDTTYSEALTSWAASITPNATWVFSGANGILGDADDTDFPLDATYTPGATDGAYSIVRLTILGDPPLPEGTYRVWLNGTNTIEDLAGLALDGDDDGIAGGDYVRTYRFDQTAPTVSIVGVSPDPTNEAVDTIEIVFDEPVRGLGLADLRLRRDGGANLLTGLQTLATGDGITWTLGNLAGLTDQEGSFALTLDATGSGIRDLAGNSLQVGAADTWVVDKTPPKVIGATTIDTDSNGSVDEIAFTFSEPVVAGSFVIADLTLSLFGQPINLDGTSLATTDGGITWTLSGLGDKYADDGLYLMTLHPNNTPRDPAGNALLPIFRVPIKIDDFAPTAQILDVLPNPRATAIDEFVIRFSEPVSGIGVSDFALSRDGGGNLLTGAETITTLDNINWHLKNLSTLTSISGNYVLTLDAAGSSIVDLAGNLLAASTSSSAVLVDTVPPTVTIDAVTPDPNSSQIRQLVIRFSEPVSPFVRQNLTLTRDGGSDLITEAQTLTTSDNQTWVFGNLAELTAEDGDYTLTLGPNGMVPFAIWDHVGNALMPGISESWTQDFTPPQVDIHDIVPDPRVDAVEEVTIEFTEPVTGFDLADLSLTRDGGPNLLSAAQTLVQKDPRVWTLTGLEQVTDQPGQYQLSLRATGSGIADLAGNLLGTGTFDAWRVVSTPINELVLRREGNNLVLVSNSVVIQTFPLPLTSPVVINGQDNVDDALTVDISALAGAVGDVLVFNGGEGGNDTLRIIGGAGGQAQYTFANVSDGQVEIDGMSIAYTGLEPILDELRRLDRIFVFGDGNDEITLGDNDANWDSILRISSTASESVDFVVAQTSPMIKAGGGDDVVTIAVPTVPRLDAGSGHDALQFSLAGLTLDLTSIADGDLKDLERIDIRGTGANTLTFDVQKVLNISDTTDTLEVLADSDDTVNFGAGWALVGTEVTGDRFYRVLEQGAARLLLSGPRDWQNPIESYDVNMDGTVAPIDVLIIFNELNDPHILLANGLLPPANTIHPSSFYFLDVNGDGFVAPIDALVIINLLNANQGGEGGGGEGEAGLAAASLLTSPSFVTAFTLPEQRPNGHRSAEQPDDGRQHQGIDEQSTVRTRRQDQRLGSRHRSAADLAALDLRSDWSELVDAYFATPDASW
jgi:hypothetical protein